MTDKWKEFDEPHSDFDWDAPMWPREVGYANKEHASNNAHRFIAARERSGGKLICSDDVVYSLGADNVWHAMADAELMGEIRATDPEIVLDVRKISGMVAEIKIACRTTARPFEWINEPNDAPAKNDLILCGNGILDVRTMTLRPLTPDYFATAIPEWDYDADATCPLWLQKLGEWLAPSYHPTLQEFTGYLLTPDTSLHAMLCLLGESRGGKGTVSRIQTALVGRAHCAFPAFNDIAGDFGLQGLDDKRLIGVPDAHDTAANKRGMAIERLKSISAGDPVTINRKNLKQQPDVILPAKIVLTANEHPNLLDESGALANREILILFENSFHGARRDVHLTDKLKDELSGIANWAIAGLRRLRKNGGQFALGDEGKAAHEELAASQSIALRFASAALDLTGDPDDIVPVALAFAAYEHWASFDEGLNPRQRRDKTGFRKDMVAALRKHGVGFAKNQVRWRDPNKPTQRTGERVKHRFVGMRLKRDAAAALEFG